MIKIVLRQTRLWRRLSLDLLQNFVPLPELELIILGRIVYQYTLKSRWLIIHCYVRMVLEMKQGHPYGGPGVSQPSVGDLCLANDLGFQRVSKLTCKGY